MRYQWVWLIRAGIGIGRTYQIEPATPGFGGLTSEAYFHPVHRLLCRLAASLRYEK
ncbi:TPA: hypothetical protein PC573_004606 [Klebsiella variicola]|uniref:hypothetical protein n=1 Tax=Klebsiella variicola TaxID=244366 RepID=UPI00224E0223|nr:hypothetical protein [Klebsiella variicola]HBZ8092469.1 hypothetical protein [Klebsiella variicola subsp. variicola]HDF2349268.1 hypothetical protein [Klebsiella variicola]HDU5636374.1 hypothetical protein [Klebsiella variicola]